MAISEITDENFEEKVVKSPNVWCLRFTAEWCGPCKQLAPIVEQISEEIKDVESKFSKEILSALYKHSSDQSYIYRHKWTQGDLVVWDNRCVMHYAEHGYGNQNRTMHRITTAGSKPF